MKRSLLSLIILSLLCTWVSAETFVWKAEKEGSVMYLGGTIHLLRPSDFPPPAEFEAAYKLSSVLVFEADIGQLHNPAIQQKLLSKAVYTDGSTVEAHLSPKAYKLLEKYCASNAIPLEGVNRFKPSMISMFLLTMELMKMGVSPEGIDLFFYNKGTADEKTIETFETIDDQIDFMMNMGAGHEDALITQTIKDMKTLQKDYEGLIKAWRSGDVTTIDAEMVAKMKKDSPSIYKALLVDRNKAWLPKIHAYQKTPETEFILVGAAHLVGSDGLIPSLKKAGYTVEKLSVE